MNPAVRIEHDEERGLVGDEAADVDPLGDRHRGAVAGRHLPERVGVALAAVSVRAVGHREVDPLAGVGCASEPVEQAGIRERWERRGDAVRPREHRVDPL